MAVALHYAHGERSLANGHGGALDECLAATVDGDQEIVGTRLYVERHLTIVADNDGADVKTVGRNGRETERACLRHDDGTTVGKRIGGGTCGRGHDESVCLVGDEIFAIHTGAYANHRGVVALEHSNVVESVRTAYDKLSLGLNHYGGVVVDDIMAFVHGIESLDDL